MALASIVVRVEVEAKYNLLFLFSLRPSFCLLACPPASVPGRHNLPRTITMPCGLPRPPESSDRKPTGKARRGDSERFSLVRSSTSGYTIVLRLTFCDFLLRCLDKKELLLDTPVLAIMGYGSARCTHAPDLQRHDRLFLPCEKTCSLYV